MKHRRLSQTVLEEAFAEWRWQFTTIQFVIKSFRTRAPLHGFIEAQTLSATIRRQQTRRNGQTVDKFRIAMLQQNIRADEYLITTSLPFISIARYERHGKQKPYPLLFQIVKPLPNQPRAAFQSASSNACHQTVPECDFVTAIAPMP